MCHLKYFELAILIVHFHVFVLSTSFLIETASFEWFFFQMVEWQSVDTFSSSSFITVNVTVAISFILVSACPNYVYQPESLKISFSQETLIA